MNFEEIIKRLKFLEEEFVETSKRHQIDAANQAYKVLIENKFDNLKDTYYSWGHEVAYRQAANRLKDNIDYLKSLENK